MGTTVRNLIAGLFFISCACPLYGQGDCVPDQTLSHAEAEFNAGHFYSIPTILKKCIDEGKFSQEQSVRAYLLLCQVYLLIDDPISAEDSYLKLLRADPEFVPNDKDHPIDVVYLSTKFTATPIFTPHFRLGLNTSFFRSIYSVTTEPYAVSVRRPLHFGLQLGGGIDWNINDNISLCAEIDLATRGYERVSTGVAGADEESVIGSQVWIDLPVYLKYSYTLKKNTKIRPFGYVGFAMNYMLSANNEFTFTDNKPAGSQLVAEGPSETVSYQRNLLNRSWLVGGGVKYKIGKDFVYADLRYMGGLSNMARENQIYYTNRDNVDPKQIGNPGYYLSDHLTKYRYVSDLFRLDNISLSFGYVHPIYDPRKIKRARTKGVAKQINKEEGGKDK